VTVAFSIASAYDPTRPRTGLFTSHDRVPENVVASEEREARLLEGSWVARPNVERR
jgi:hypothetical protein